MIDPELYFRTLIMPREVFTGNEQAGRPKFIGNNDVDVLDWASDLIVWAAKISIHPPQDDAHPVEAPAVRSVTAALVALEQRESAWICGIVSPFSTLSRLYTQRALALDHAEVSPHLDLRAVAWHAARAGLLSGWTAVRDPEGESVVQTVSGKAIPEYRIRDGDEVLKSVMLSYRHTSVTLLGDFSGIVHEYPDELQLLGRELRECLGNLLVYSGVNATT